MICDVEHFLNMSIVHLYVLLGELSVQVLCPFLIGLFLFLVSVGFFCLFVFNFLSKSVGQKKAKKIEHIGAILNNILIIYSWVLP